ncbi:peptidase MA family metallohydrolase [Chloroflexota bacterium]
MIKKVNILAIVAYLFLALLSPGLAQAGSGLKILDTSDEVDFPFKLSFSLSAESDVNITDIRLYYTVDQAGFAQVTSEVFIEFTPATSVEAKWTWDMRKTGGIPSGSTVYYWWMLEDANGKKLETAPLRTQFDDTRYSWHSLTRDRVTIYWYDGDKSFAQELMVAAQQALARLFENTGAHLEEPVKIYVYTSAQDLRGAMVYPQDWTGGVAFTRFGIIAIGIAPDILDWGKRAVAHELTHLVIHQMTLNPYNDLPTWLNEGLAMYTEGTLEPGFATYLNTAIAEDNLISVRSLSSPFSAYAGESYLSYAQSYSLVEFLISNYGQGEMLELLNTFKQGSSYDEALFRVYAFDMDSLNTLWRDYATEQFQPKVITKAVMPLPLIGVLAALATGLLLGFSLFMESWVWRRG